MRSFDEVYAEWLRDNPDERDVRTAGTPALAELSLYCCRFGFSLGLTQTGPTQREVHDLAESKGWYDTQRLVEQKLIDSGATAGMLQHVRAAWIAARLALIAAEVSEALELVRKGEVGSEDWGKELADISIRVKDLAEATGVDLPVVERAKHEYNKTRPHKHGGKVL